MSIGEAKIFMNIKRPAFIASIGLIIVAAIIVIGLGFYTNSVPAIPTPVPEGGMPVLKSPTPTSSPTPTETPLLPTPTEIPQETVTTPVPEIPPGGIVYTISPDINSVGWVQADETGNHFGESYIYTGLREGVLYHGAMQFDLSFIAEGSTIFSAELELTGVLGEALAESSTFQAAILAEEVDEGWSRHNFDIISSALIDEILQPVLTAADVAPDQTNRFLFNAAQRSIVEDRLGTTHRLSLRLDSLAPEQTSWFAWDSGYGPETRGQGPVLRLGVLPPIATDEVEVAGATPTSTPTFILITSTPTPENMQTAAAIAPRLTYEATTTGTPTPLPPNWVTPLAITETPTPENTATALFQQAEAAAAIVALGTPTPTPQNMVMATPTATATATPVYILLEGELPPMTPVPVPTVIPQLIPAQLLDKIAFKSDRSGQEQIYVMNPDGSELALLTHCWAYAMAEQADSYSADGRYRVFTKDMVRYRNLENFNPDVDPDTVRNDAPALYWYDLFYKTEELLTEFGAGIAYGGVWSPTREQIAFVSNDSSSDEIWVVNRDSSGLVQVTRDEHSWWDKHPSWSPDGNQIVFWSNRTGHGQIWLMNPDGSNQYSLSRTGFNDWDPIWIKYPGIPDGQGGYIPSLGACGATAGQPDTPGLELNCFALNSQAEAQALYKTTGGPKIDLYGLDMNRDGIACDAMLPQNNSPFEQTGQ